ncbi:hypothetical protein UlMin_011154 [Ulmus minor]
MDVKQGYKCFDAHFRGIPVVPPKYNLRVKLYGSRDLKSQIKYHFKLLCITDGLKTPSQNTILHLASLAGEVDLVNKLVELMKEKDLEIKDKDGYTALAKASINGDERIAQCMVEKNGKLVSIPTGTKLLPVVIAIMYGNKEMAAYLYSKTPSNDLTNGLNIHGATLLTYSIKMQFYDISFELIKTHPRLAVALDHNDQSALYQLACTPSAFHSGSKLNIWQKWMYNCIQVPKSTRRNAGLRGLIHLCLYFNFIFLSIFLHDFLKKIYIISYILGIYEMKSVHHQSLELLDLICQQIKDNLDDDEINGIINALHEAAAKGVVEFIVGVLKKFPEFRWLRDKEGSTIFMKAVQFRQADVFCLIHEFPYKDKMIVLVDNCGENILHKLEYSSVDKISTIQGGLIKMQKELKWFQEIKSMMPPDSLEKRNNEKKTAQQLFDESHKELMINAEKGMKETANSCIIVGILVVTIMFAAAFTVPGGNDQDTGFPLFLNINLFKIFIISDALSLCFSTTSVLMFLGILTSRYAEKDFLEPLPRKMIIALSSLFISITAMMIAFTAALFITLLRTEFWISLPITTLFASLPVILFARLLFPLLSEYVMSTYGSSIFNRKSKLLSSG